MSEHFVYIENQFFITSTVVNEVKIENKIGDALVHRIIRAHREETPWKCCIVIPLIPGFAFPIDHSDASAIRIIVECQNRTICRGPNSIFARLRKEGIDPDEYITFFSLRNWAKLRGNVLTTEQVYIHGKVCIVDDRLAIIGSANINERSQRGDRDSEIAAVIRDTDMIDCTMAGKPFKVGRFAHTLRVRLMREHIGVDVDKMYEDDLMASEPAKSADMQTEWDPELEQEHGKEAGVTQIGKRQRRTAMGNILHDTVDEIEQALHGTSDAGFKDVGVALRKVGIKSKGLDMTAGEKSLKEERHMYARDGTKEPGFPSSIVPTLEEKVVAEHRPPPEQAFGSPIIQELHEDGAAPNGLPPNMKMQNGELLGAPANAVPSANEDSAPPCSDKGKNDADEEEATAPEARDLLRKHAGSKLKSKPWTLPTPTPRVDPQGFEDPVCDGFWKNVWLSCAVHNTEIYRRVFHAIPDDLVTTWKQYKEFVVHHERLNQPVWEAESREPLARMPSEAADQDAPGHPHTMEDSVHAPDYIYHTVMDNGHGGEAADSRSVLVNSSSPPATATEKDFRGRRAPNGVEPFDESDKEEMEKLLGELRGHLGKDHPEIYDLGSWVITVVYPTRFLEGEDATNNFLFNADRMMPLPIYD
ncbi:uncharacterized protein FIBRA_00405 [Fibroporia radiculosa]|uniref:phospholipase D n=1 Tax=Fibroporia radiculosa TaxID=599839 RepID=J4G066_9APHY|nr:uncharacterized protein FIBRA_00405 [Fibroporia radiculosa]CCL98408.1 predicted protein [Fibroporia radiculosa]